MNQRNGKIQNTVLSWSEPFRFPWVPCATVGGCLWVEWNWSFRAVSFHRDDAICHCELDIFYRLASFDADG
jgi:hypothetical protein